MKLLLVEDEGIVREGLKLLLQALVPAAVVTAVGSAEAATKACDQSVFDFIFLDIKLGDDWTAGLDLLDVIKGRGIETPVIVLSNQVDKATVHEAVDRGAYGFVRKQDEDLSHITQAMEFILKGGVYLPRATILGRGGNVPPSANPMAASLAIKTVTAAALGLSPRQYEAAYYIATGLRYKQVADKMGVTDAVATEHAGKVYQKLGVGTRQGFMTYLNQQGFQLEKPVKA